MKRLSLALLLLILAVWPACAQPVTVIGPAPTPGDCARFFSTTQIQDAGFNCTGSVGPIVFGPGSSVVGDVATWNNTTGTLLADTHAWSAVPGPGGAQLYAAPTVQGTGSCLSQANACTLVTACAFRTSVATFISGGFNINLANGTYSAVNSDNALCSVYGNSGGSASALTSIIGNVVSGSCVSQTAVVLAVPNSDIGILVKDGGEIVINCVEFTLGTNAIGLQNAGQGAVSDYGNVTWGTAGSGAADITGSFGSYINLGVTGETITGNRASHWNLSGNAVLNAGGTTTLTGTPAFSGSFIATAGSSNLFLAGWTSSGAATGTRAVLTGPGRMVTAGAASCNSVFPGGAACQLSGGFQDNAGDLQTDGIFLNNIMPATVRNGDIVVNNGSGWWQSLAGNNSGTRFLFEDGSGNPGWGPVTGTGSTVVLQTSPTINSPTLTTPNLGTPSTLVLTNATGLPVAGGGTGNATAAAHSIPVSEGTSPQAAVGPCATNQVIVGGGAGADPTCGLNTAGAMVNLCTITASNSATMSYASPSSGTCTINGTYTSYLLVFLNIVPATDSKILELQIHSGGTFKTTGYVSSYGGWINGTGVATGGITTYIALSYAADSTNQSLHNAAPGLSGQVTLTNPSANAIMMVSGQTNYVSVAVPPLAGQLAGYWNTAGVVDGFQVLMDSGNITSGSIIIYGIL